ncbi:MAG: YebC/PmpR family DNA-binding transcriptional regulator [Puniceicoccales bacterium]|jgi:YebC/PmpR family DNA-binding regulatory protein|nr:YebC/PmpR family DNA-binding transcriptional regulator [Puniceicoccales bacterium]
MSGHSKWSTIKRHKAAIDAKRGKIFSLIGKEITLAAKVSGGNPEFNPQLRTLMLKAKAANMPGENIQKAIQKGTGEILGVQIEELIYEGYGPGGIGFIVEVTTDNKNRTVSDIRSTFTKYGGSLAGTGALAFNFQRKGQCLIASDKIGEDALLEVALNAGAEDVINKGDHFEVICQVNDFYALVKAFEDIQLETASAELVYLPINSIEIHDREWGEKILKLVEKLEDLEDVKNVFSNYDLDASLGLEA